MLLFPRIFLAPISKSLKAGWITWSSAFGVSLWSEHKIVSCRSKLVVSSIVLLMGCMRALSVNRKMCRSPFEDMGEPGREGQ